MSEQQSLRELHLIGEDIKDAVRQQTAREAKKRGLSEVQAQEAANFILVRLQNRCLAFLSEQGVCADEADEGTFADILPVMAEIASNTYWEGRDRGQGDKLCTHIKNAFTANFESDGTYVGSDSEQTPGPGLRSRVKAVLAALRL